MKAFETVMNFLNSAKLIGPVALYVNTLLQNHGLKKKDAQEAVAILESVLGDLLEQEKEPQVQPLKLELVYENGEISISIHNLNRPIHQVDIASLALVCASRKTTLSLQNKGRFGQVFEIKIPNEIGDKKEPRKADFDEKFQSQPPPQTPENIGWDVPKVCVRSLRVGEEFALSDLFYKIYGYKYINEWVYFPEKFRTLIETGELHSVVAANECDLMIGHIGVRTMNHQPKVAEMCLGLTDPTSKSKGYFSQIFDSCIDHINANHFSYSFFDCVTNHDLSQRHIQKHGGIDTALFVGCQSKETQARLANIGLGSDPQGMDRYSILYSIIPFKKTCFGSEVVLPIHLGDLLGFLLEPLGLTWIPASRVDVLPRAGHYDTVLDSAQNSAFFNLNEPGMQPLLAILERWRNLLRDGFEYAAVDIPLGSPGLATAHELLAKNGFFIAGFFPWQNSGTLALRLQSLAPKRVAFDHIKVLSLQAKKLLKIVREDYERNSLI